MKNSSTLFYLKKIQRISQTKNFCEEKKVHQNCNQKQKINFESISKKKKIFFVFKLNLLGKRRNSFQTSNFTTKNLQKNKKKLYSFCFQNSKFVFIKQKLIKMKGSLFFLKAKKKRTLFKQFSVHSFVKNISCVSKFLRYKLKRKLTQQFFDKKKYRNMMFQTKKVFRLKHEPFFFLKKANLFHFLFISSFQKNFLKKTMKIFFPIFQNFLQNQILNLQEIYSLFFVKNTKNCLNSFKYLPNFLFFKFFFPAILQEKQSLKESWNKIQMNKFRKNFFEIKTNIAKFFCKKVFDMNLQKKVKKKKPPLKQSGNEQSFGNFWNFDFLDSLSFKLKSILLKFFFEIQFYFFSNLQNFQKMKIEKNEFQMYFNRKKFLQANKQNKNKLDFFFQNFFSHFEEKKKKRYIYFFFENLKEFDKKMLSFFKLTNNFVQQPIIFVSQKNEKKEFFDEKRQKQSICFLSNPKNVQIQNKRKEVNLQFQNYWCLKFLILCTSFFQNFSNKKKLEKNCQILTVTSQKNFSINQLLKKFIFQKKKISERYQKSLFLTSLILFQNFLAPFGEYFSCANFLKIKNDSSQNFHDFEMIFYQFLKVPLSSFEAKIEKTKRFLSNTFFFEKNSQKKMYSNLTNKKQSFLQGFFFKIQTFLYSPFFSFHLEKKSFHLFQTFKVKKITKQAKTKIHFLFFSNGLFFKNFCFINNLKKHFLQNPLDLIFQTYHGNFLFYNSTILFFTNSLNLHNFLKLLAPSLENFVLSKEFFVFNISLKYFLQGSNKNFFQKFSFIHFLNLRHFPPSNNQTNIQTFLKFQNVLWLFSKKLTFLQAQLGRIRFFQFSSLFPIYSLINSQEFFPIKKKYFQNSLFFKMNLSSFNFDGFCFSFHFENEKNLQKFFSFATTLTRQNIDLHLKECKKILKNSLGQKQFHFMKKLQKKIQCWCEQYRRISEKSVFYYCDSMLLKFLWNWACRTHPNKSKYWIRKKYFHFIHSKKWFFGKKIGKKFLCLPLHAQTLIETNLSQKFTEYFYPPTFLHYLKS